VLIDQSMTGENTTADMSQHLHRSRNLQLVVEIGKRWNVLLQALPNADLLDSCMDGRLLVQRIAGHGLPMVEHALGEGLARCCRAEVSREAERLSNGKIRLVDNEDENITMEKSETTSGR
jgi:hypothetical protein